MIECEQNHPIVLLNLFVNRIPISSFKETEKNTIAVVRKKGNTVRNWSVVSSAHMTLTKEAARKKATCNGFRRRIKNGTVENVFDFFSVKQKQKNTDQFYLLLKLKCKHLK